MHVSVAPNGAFIEKTHTIVTGAGAPAYELSPLTGLTFVAACGQAKARPYIPRWLPLSEAL